MLDADPNCSGSLGIAISEAVEMAVRNPDVTKYCLGSVLNHVLLHQTVIGEEALLQMDMAQDEPDIVIGCFGGGSNFSGIAFPFLKKNFQKGKHIRVIAVEPASCPKLTRGTFQYDFGDTAGFTPLIPMYTLGHNFQPADIHAGGLRYHGAGAIVSQLLKDGLIRDLMVYRDNLTDEEKLYYETVSKWIKEEAGYMSIQSTKPQTLAFALSDSPIGLAAWIFEKFYSWGDWQSCLSYEDIITNIMIYWITNSIYTSCRVYHENSNHLTPIGGIKVPTGVSLFFKRY